MFPDQNQLEYERASLEQAEQARLEAEMTREKHRIEVAARLCSFWQRLRGVANQISQIRITIMTIETQVRSLVTEFETLPL